MSHKELTDDNFKEEVLENDKPVVVDFWAPWCGPCQMVGPVIEQVGKEIGDDAVIGKLNVDENPSTASKYGITGIPAIYIFKNGEPVKQLVGVQPKDTYVNALKEVID